MKTFILVKDCTDYPQDVAHVYEHWFIMSFYAFAEKTSGVHGGAIGYVGGETFQNVIFVEAWFYAASNAAVFEQFLLNQPLSEDLLQTCILQCQAEDRAIWNIHDQKLLNTQLSDLAAMPWQHGNNLTPYMYNDTVAAQKAPMTITAAASRYRSITIVSRLPDGSVEDQAVFQRLYVLIEDIINQLIQTNGWHTFDSLPPRHSSTGSCYTVLGLCVPRSTMSNHQIAVAVQQYLDDFDVIGHMPSFNAHFSEFAAQPIWRGRMRDSLHHLPVISGNNAIARLATAARIRRIIDSLDISVSTESHDFVKNITH